MKNHNLLFILILISFTLFSCTNIFDQDGLSVDITIRNKTVEPLLVFGRWKDPLVTILPGRIHTITVKKGERVAIRGEDSNKTYRSCTADTHGLWVIEN